MRYILIIICAILAGVFLYAESRKQYVTAVALKGVASLCFVILGITSSPGGHTARMIVLGLIFGFVADILLNLRMVFQEKGQLIFLVGILVFLTGHIFYLAAVAPLAQKPIVCIILGVILTVLLMIWIFKQITAKMAFKVFGVVYIGAIMLLNCFAISNLITDPSAFTGIFAVGAVLFLISDIVLILNTFGGEFKQKLRNVNISLYYAGQILIALSLLKLR